MPSFVFFLVIALYLLASCYIAAKVCRALKFRPLAWRIVVWVVVLLLDFSFFLSRLVPGEWLSAGRVLYVVSTTWLPVVLYGSMSLLVLDVLRLLLTKTRGATPYHTPLMVKMAGWATLLVMLIGHFVAVSPQETRYTVFSNKLPAGQDYTLALVSDIHAGYAVTEGDVAKIVEIVNSAGADMTLIAGDLVDGSLAPVWSENALARLADVRSPMGVFAVMGNHEYIDDADDAARYIRSLRGVTLLRDSCADAGPFRVIGRDDISLGRAGRARMPIEGFACADSLFTIVMDHQPGAVADAVAIGADLSLSGHTHGGQIWPMNIITGMIYELDYGFACYGSTAVVVTSGFGTWGPRMRVGSVAEVVFIDVCGTARRS